MKPTIRSLVLLLATCSLAGCVIDDSGGARGQSSALTASVPDSGSPIRRERASQTLNEGGGAQTPSEGSLEVEPSETK